MPDLRFAIGAVLAIALLIVAVFGLAATVQVAHHRSATADDPWRTLAFPDPTDWGLLADRSRPATVPKVEAPEELQAGVTATTPDPEMTRTTIVPKNARAPSDRVVPQEAKVAQAAEPTLDPPPTTIPAASTEAIEPDMVPTEHEPVDVVAAVPATTAAPVRPAEPAPAIERPANDDEPLEPSERVGALPAFPTAGHGFVPPEHPIAVPVPLPPSKPAMKNLQKKKVARSRRRTFPFLPYTGYPVFGYGKFGPNGKTTGYDKMWTAE